MKSYGKTVTSLASTGSVGVLGMNGPIAIAVALGLVALGTAVLSVRFRFRPGRNISQR